MNNLNINIMFLWNVNYKYKLKTRAIFHKNVIINIVEILTEIVTEMIIKNVVSSFYNILVTIFSLYLTNKITLLLNKNIYLMLQLIDSES